MKITTKYMSIFIILFQIFIFSSCDSNKEEIDLKLNLQDGFEETYKFRETTSGSLVKLEMMHEIKFSLDSKKENSFLFDANLISVYSNSSFGGTDDIYDSKKDVSEMSETELENHNEYKNFLESTFSFELSDLGAIVKDLGLKGDDAEITIVNLNNFQITYPKTKVSVGSTWDTEWHNNILMPSTVKAKFKVSKITANTVEIEATHNVSQDGGLLPTTAKKGKYVIDRNTGILISMNMKSKLSMGGELTSTITRNSSK